jgi:P-type Cu+ transporter
VSLLSEHMAAEAAGHTAVLVGWSGQARGLLVVADQIKASSGEAVRHLRALGLNPILLSGDNVSAANTVARAVGITQVIAEVRPEEKVTVIRQLQARGEAVAMVGDGVNDAAALAEADLGLAMGTGTDAAIEAAPITLVRGDLCAAADAIRLARSTLKIIKANLFWAFAYNVISLPIAAAGLLEPMIAGATMAFSSVFVVTNSLRLRRFAPLPAVPSVAAFSSSRTPPTAMPASTVPPAEPVAHQPVEPAASTVRIPRQRTASQPRPFMPNRCGYPQRATKRATVNAGGKHRRPGSQPPSVRQPMPGRSAW